AADRGARATLVTGDAGIGKSRLLGALWRGVSRMLPRPPMLVWRGAPYHPAPRATARGPALRLFIGLPQSGAGDDAAMRRALALPVALRELLGEPFDTQDANASPQVSARLLALLTYVRALGESAPVVLVIDDLEWCDDETLDLLHRLLAVADLP